MAKIAEYLKQAESKILEGVNQNDTHNHERNPTHNAMCREDYTAVVERLLPINHFLRDSFIKVGRGMAFSEKLRAYFDFIPEAC